MANECSGCQINIGGVPHFHIGAAVFSKNGLWAAQDPDTPEACVALVIRCHDGMPALVIPKGVPPEAAQPILLALRQQYTDREMEPSLAREMYNLAKDGFKAAHRCGALVRDFRGNWHFSGDSVVQSNRKTTPSHG